MACTTSMNEQVCGELKTLLLLRGEPHRLDPLSVEETVLPPLPGGKNGSTLSPPSSVLADHQSPGAWKALAKRVMEFGVLRIGVLGMSTTSGCGALEWAGSGTELRCDLIRSWARRMAEQLHPTLCANLNWQMAGGVAGRRPTIDVRVHAKNAVTPDYFARCTRRFLPIGTDIALLEVSCPQGRQSGCAWTLQYCIAAPVV